MLTPVPTVSNPHACIENFKCCMPGSLSSLRAAHVTLKVVEKKLFWALELEVAYRCLLRYGS